MLPLCETLLKQLNCGKSIRYLAKPFRKFGPLEQTKLYSIRKHESEESFIPEVLLPLRDKAANVTPAAKKIPASPAPRAPESELLSKCH